MSGEKRQAIVPLKRIVSDDTFKEVDGERLRSGERPDGLRRNPQPERRSGLRSVGGRRGGPARGRGSAAELRRSRRPSRSGLLRFERLELSTRLLVNEIGEHGRQVLAITDQAHDVDMMIGDEVAPTARKAGYSPESQLRDVAQLSQAGRAGTRSSTDRLERSDRGVEEAGAEFITAALSVMAGLLDEIVFGERP